MSAPNMKRFDQAIGWFLIVIMSLLVLILAACVVALWRLAIR